MRRTAKVAALASASAMMPQILYAPGPSVELWVTSSDEAGVVAGLEAQPSLFFRPDADDATVAIKVDDGKVYRRMEGGGAAFTAGAAWLINQKVSAATMAVPLSQLVAIKPDQSTAEAIGDWRYRVTQGYCF